MGSLKFPKLLLHLCVVIMTLLPVLYYVESVVYVHFDQVPPEKSRFSTAVFRYSVINHHKQRLCKGLGCSFYCEVRNASMCFF